MNYRHWPGLCLLFFFIQGAMLPFWWPGAHLPDLWLVATILLTFFAGPQIGLLTALVGGLAQDVVFGNFFGLHLAGYCAAVIGMLPAWNHLQVRWNIVFLAVFLISPIVGAAQYLFLLAAGESVQFLPYLVQIVLPSTAVNTLFSVPLYLLLRPHEREI